MKICFTLSQLLVIAFLSFEPAYPQAVAPQARIVNLNVEPEQVIVLHLEPGYVSSVRVLEDVSSVVLGDPGSFRAEHSDAEPQLVFFKATSSKSARTNALITTKAGRNISLSLVSNGKQGHGEIVDYVLNCERPRSFLISPALPSVLVAENKTVAISESTTSPAPPATKPSEELSHIKLRDPHWKGGTSGYSCMCADTGATVTCNNNSLTSPSCPGSYVEVTLTVQAQTTFRPLVSVPGLPTSFNLVGTAQQDVLQ